MKATYYGKSDIGKVRANNEDALIAREIWDSQHLLLTVIDGIGGHEGGEVAAEIAHDTIIRYLEDFPKGKCLEQLKLAVVNANNEIVRYKEFAPKCDEMGCVLTALLIELYNNMINVVHMGDTRLYQYHNGTLQRQTHDHSLIGALEDTGELTEEEAMHHPLRNRIGSFLGDSIRMYDDMEFVDTAIYSLLPGSQLLLSSDRLYNMVTSSEICLIIQQPITTEQKVKRLIAKANENGGKDNITVIIVEFDSVATNV